MTTTRELSNDGIAFIKHWEGYRRQMYLCASGKATIGYGHRVTPMQLRAYQNGVDMPTALRILKGDLKHFVELIDYTCPKELTQAQFDMLVSFVFNVGSTAFLNSTLLKHLQAKHFDLASKELTRWVHDDHGRIIPGLVNRRKAEQRIFDGKISAAAFLQGGSGSNYHN